MSEVFEAVAQKTSPLAVSMAAPLFQDQIWRVPQIGLSPGSSAAHVLTWWCCHRCCRGSSSRPCLSDTLKSYDGIWPQSSGRSQGSVLQTGWSAHWPASCSPGFSGPTGWPGAHTLADDQAAASEAVAQSSFDMRPRSTLYAQPKTRNQPAAHQPHPAYHSHERLARHALRDGVALRGGEREEGHEGGEGGGGNHRKECVKSVRERQETREQMVFEMDGLKTKPDPSVCVPELRGQQSKSSLAAFRALRHPNLAIIHRLYALYSFFLAAQKNGALCIRSDTADNVAHRDRVRRQCACMAARSGASCTA